MEGNSFENEYFHIYIKDGICRCDFKKGVVLTKEITDVFTEERIKVCEGKTYSAIGDLRYVKYWTLQSRVDGLQAEDTFDFASKGAVVLSSYAIRIAWLWAIKLFTPRIEVQAFSSMEKAIEWAKGEC